MRNVIKAALIAIVLSLAAPVAAQDLDAGIAPTLSCSGAAFSSTLRKTLMPFQLLVAYTR